MKFEIYAREMKFKVLTLQEQFFLPECLVLLERTQGTNVCNLDYLTGLLTEEVGRLFVYFNDQSEIIAVAGAKVLPSGSFEYYRPFGEETFSLMNRSKVGSFCTMSVREDFQGKGLGMKLALAREEWLVSQGCNLLVGISWVSGQNNNSANVFKKMGFKAVKEIKDFFVESSHLTNLLCPVCKTPPCTCAGVLFTKEVS